MHIYVYTVHDLLYTLFTIIQKDYRYRKTHCVGEQFLRRSRRRRWRSSYIHTRRRRRRKKKKERRRRRRRRSRSRRRISALHISALHISCLLMDQYSDGYSIGVPPTIRSLSSVFLFVIVVFFIWQFCSLALRKAVRIICRKNYQERQRFCHKSRQCTGRPNWSLESGKLKQLNQLIYISEFTDDTRLKYSG